MRDILEQIEKELPELLWKDDWNSIDVNYHPPRVERVWRQWGDYRINLHRIHPCEEGEALFHPHPWPSIVRIIEGGYWTRLGKAGFAEQDYDQWHYKPTTSHKLFVGPGSIIVDSDKWSWHSVAPTEIIYSLMITGKPWGMNHWGKGLVERPKMELRALRSNAVDEILATFETWYDGKQI